MMATILASCNKSEPEAGHKDVNEYDKIKINLSVSNLSGGDSKTIIKTDWAEGDQLLIWFDENAGEKPDIVIRYNGSGWDQDESVEVSGETPAASGNMKVLYNNILCVTAKDPYTFNSGTSTLSGRIQTWTFLTEIQVVVTGLTPADYAKYRLSCNNFTPFTGYTVGAESITAMAGSANTPVNGISNTDGVAFVFASCTAYGTSSSYKFCLNDVTSSSTPAGTGELEEPDYVEIKAKYNGTDESTLKWAKWNIGASKPEECGYYFFWGGTQGYVYGSVKESPEYIKNLVQNVSQIKGIKIASNRFTTRKCWVKAENGEELVDGFCWKNTPFNDGSSDYNADYFAGVRSTVCPDDVLAPAYDAAHNYLGDGWRMFTCTELQAMKDVTYWYFYSGTDVTGFYIFLPDESHPAGGGVYKPNPHLPEGLNKADALLFLPAAGYGMDNDLIGHFELGTYFSGRLYPDYPVFAYSLTFNRSYFYVTTTQPRYDGNTIRPVSE